MTIYLSSLKNLREIEQEHKKLEKQYKTVQKQVVQDIKKILELNYVYLIKINLETQTIFILERFDYFNPTDKQLQELSNYLKCKNVTVESVSGIVVISW